MEATPSLQTRNNRVAMDVDDEAPLSAFDADSTSCISLSFAQKLIAEMVGTYYLVFAGCGSSMVNFGYDEDLTHPGVAITWGLVVMILIYSVGHISGAHLNPAITFSFAAFKRFPWRKVPPYVAAQVIGSIMASGTLRLMFGSTGDFFAGTLPSGSDLQSFIMEFIITFFLMFVVSGVATDNRAVGELAGLAIGSTILLNVMFAGPVSGASMNPARSLGPAIVFNQYSKLWIYMLAPMIGALFGACAYNFVRYTEATPDHVQRNNSFFKSSSRAESSR